MDFDAIAWARRFWWLIAIVLGVIVAIWAWEKVKAVVSWPFRAGAEAMCLDGTECRAERDRLALERALSDLSARNEESEGRTALNREAERSQTIILETRTITTEAVAEAYGAPDAETPLDLERADRLRAADERLCDVADAECVPADQY